VSLSAASPWRGPAPGCPPPQRLLYHGARLQMSWVPPESRRCAGPPASSVPRARGAGDPYADQALKPPIRPDFLRCSWDAACGGPSKAARALAPHCRDPLRARFSHRARVLRRRSRPRVSCCGRAGANSFAVCLGPSSGPLDAHASQRQSYRSGPKSCLSSQSFAQEIVHLLQHAKRLGSRPQKRLRGNRMFTLL
jgi:hypothetical protein